MDPYHYNVNDQNNKGKGGASNSNQEGNGKGVTWVMGTPVAPQAHPVNQQAATWVAGDATPSAPPIQAGTVSCNAHPQVSNPYVQTTPAPESSSKRHKELVLNVLGRWGKKLEDCTKKAEGYAENVWQHLKTSPSVTDAAMTRLAQGTKVLSEGGRDKVFHQMFGILPDEKVLKAYSCYLSTSSGPVIGTLYISTKRVAFCSDSPLCHYTASGQEWMYYKVVVTLIQLMAVNPSSNRLNPSDKYIQILTVDGHEFWFMGFVSYDKALKNLGEALEHRGSHSSGSH
ncbi:PREDICTED: GEM-like protein 1 [Nelumbo nucifera]|uniref:GEM-like protein 1 n=2 Tax=Nelumbo nucifera TaxID=4432 RepID=A0A1U7YZV0_NELNU|nr:PREDICTED: GEM-like protein 1 [Nelumbo nucifera]DAD32776.1 TPA_asm: hypothetical protein HUJ06_011627 [Nelumbo nucifera]